MNTIDNKTLSLQIGFALELFKTQKFNEALIQYEYIINNFKFNFPEIYIAYGNCLLALGKLDEAEDSFKKALDKNEKLSDAVLGLAKVYLYQKKFALAETLFAKLVDEESSLNAANYLAYIYENQERYDEAEYLYLTVLEINGELHEAWNNLALFYKTCRKDEKKAISAHENSLKLEEKLEYFQNYALTLLEFNHPKEALKLINKCLKIEPNNAEIKKYLEVATSELQKKEEQNEQE